MSFFVKTENVVYKAIMSDCPRTMKCMKIMDVFEFVKDYLRNQEVTTADICGAVSKDGVKCYTYTNVNKERVSVDLNKGSEVNKGWHWGHFTLYCAHFISIPD